MRSGGRIPLKTTAKPDSHPSRVFCFPKKFPRQFRSETTTFTHPTMPTLAPPAPPALKPAPRPEIDVPSVSFFGRSLAEYAQFFALDVAGLRGRDVLDVAAGPSSFTAEACARKIDAVAVDPLYGGAVERLARQVE